MKNPSPLDRRRFLGRAAAGIATLSLGGCDQLSQNPWVVELLSSAEKATQYMQRLITGRNALAQEYTEAELSPVFRANGTTDPDNAYYQNLAKASFVDWRLAVGGLVERPSGFSLDEIRRMPSRTQITRHDCVEGWSCIGKWTGVPLAALLDSVGVRPEARYVMFFCADPMDISGSKYYESIDLAGAYHPQTILAYAMNDRVLPVAYGAPLRLRDERQLGYKMAKYIMRIELVESFKKFGGGHGGYWEDQGYEWYAGI
ncbi:MAG TPA: molybdopterin-binding protein [Stellaceae bacterium]|nr:molybdopterin-binding protein [Stellaceae bacterium]